ncbi:ABC-F family ATP-binding cassette domain-containing protein [Acidithiobacillus sp. IBUN Pt1247-S3]|uniref:ABC-F family ATP-binding cassette domain-containing protein n=1 Tax=Acidithiobacillus sp. IBUN Pt1247-S3 TaxID=3166642 RepID=UPI0034E3906D
MPVLELREGLIEWGGRVLLDHADLRAEAGERIGLIGRNGEGKSTLLAALAGQYPLDGGELWIDPALRRAFLTQEPELPAEQIVFDYLLASPQDSASAEVLHDDSPERWTLPARAEALCESLDIPRERQIAGLSGGQKKRLAIASTLIHGAELLFLDEPTNHMDLAGIEALEKTLLRYRGTLFFVTHDRRFLESLCTRIVELDRGQLRSFPGHFSAYQKRKEELLNAEAADLDRLEQQLATEEAWLRQGVKARAKRNQGRLRRLEQLREERKSRSGRVGEAQIRIQQSERSGNLIAELDNVHLRLGEQQILHGFSTRIERGDRVGIIGPNGAGKTTLLRLLLGELEPDAGSIRRGTRQSIAYFDQLREQLDPEMRVVDVIADGNDFIDVDGERRHVLGYLQDFLFAPDRARGLVKGLSGGERARLLLARLFAKPANILVLDEPTNDLDLESLEVLEDRLLAFPGTVLLVSHDRDFLDHVVTQSIISLGDGNWLNTAGGHQEFLAWQAAQQVATTGLKGKSKDLPQRNKTARRPKALSMRERKELDMFPAYIEALEVEQAVLAEALGQAETYQNAEKAMSLQEQAARISADLEAAYMRWEELEAKDAGLSSAE